MNSNALRIAKDREFATKRTRHIQPKSRVTVESSHALVHPLAGHIVETADLQYALNVLEETTKLSESAGKKLAKYISNDILPFVSKVDESYRMIEKIENKEIKSILESNFDDIRVASRIVNNRAALSKRFNIKNCVLESVYYPDKTDCIRSLCEKIDTYTMKPHIKMNIALENITYEFYRNNMPVNNLPSTVLEYFMTRDLHISDSDYSNYKMVLENNSIFESSDYSELYDAVISNDANEYKNMIIGILGQVITNCDDDEIESLDKCNTEADIIGVLDFIKEYIETSYPAAKERGAIYRAIKLFPLAFDVSQEFIDIEMSKRFDNVDVNDCLEAEDKLVAKESTVTFGEKIQELDANELAHAFDESSDEVKDVLVQFKAEQDKSMGKFRALINKLHARKPQDIIDGMPNLMNIVRTVFIVGTACITPIGPIIASVLGLVDFLINRKINDKQCDELLEKLRSERSTVREKIKKTANEKTKNELLEYDKALTDSIDRVRDYADSLSNTDHDDDRDYESLDGSDDLDDFDFDFDSFESGIVSIGRVLCVAEELLDFHNKSNNIEFHKNLYDTMNMLAENNMLPNFIEVAKYSDISENVINESIAQIQKYHNGFPMVTTCITNSKYIIEHGNINLSKSRSLLASYIANEAVTSITEEVVTEKVNLNTIKLALQNAKSKLKNLSTKEKSMWQSVDAQASAFTKNLEKALTSDRREAIIKGSIIPSFSKCVKGAIALAGIGLIFGPLPALITALGSFAVSKALNAREKQLIYDEIETELKVVEKQLDIAQNDGDMNQYRFLLNYQKKLTREHQRIKYGLKVSGRDIPSATRQDD